MGLDDTWQTAGHTWEESEREEPLNIMKKKENKSGCTLLYASQELNNFHNKLKNVWLNVLCLINSDNQHKFHLDNFKTQASDQSHSYKNLKGCMPKHIIIKYSRYTSQQQKAEIT